MPGDASRANGRKGGRPKGRKSDTTLERERVLREYRQRICQQAKRLLDAELTVAVGCSYLFRKPKSTPKGEPRKAELVTSPETIRSFIDGELDHDPNDFYFIVTDKPDTNTIRGMFDRTFDRPAQRVELTGEDGGTLVHRVIHDDAD